MLRGGESRILSGVSSFENIYLCPTIGVPPMFGFHFGCHREIFQHPCIVVPFSFSPYNTKIFVASYTSGGVYDWDRHGSRGILHRVPGAENLIVQQLARYLFYPWDE